MMVSVSGVSWAIFYKLDTIVGYNYYNGIYHLIYNISHDISHY